MAFPATINHVAFWTIIVVMKDKKRRNEVGWVVLYIAGNFSFLFDNYYLIKN